MICERCNHENNETSKFCNECGSPLAIHRVEVKPKRELRTVTIKTSRRLLSQLLLGVLFIVVGYFLYGVSFPGYKNVKIGEQVWMTENLNVDHFRNGDSIPEIKSDADWINYGKQGKPAWCYYANDPENGKKYGKLYNWYAINDRRGLAPEDWHIPTLEELKTLCISVSDNSNALKAVGQGNVNYDGVGTNTSGFSALLGGFRSDDGNFNTVGYNTIFWSSTEGSSNDVYILYMYYGNSVNFSDTH